MRPAQNSMRSASELEIRQQRRAAASRDRLDPLHQFVDLDAGTVEFDDQERFDVERIAGVDEGFGGVDRRLVHHFHAAGDDAGADDPRHAFAGRLDLGEADHQRARGLRLRRIAP